MEWGTFLALSVGLRFLMALALRLQGRRWWCRCGQWLWWNGAVQSMHNSQHLADPYSVTHLEHGFLFCWLLAVVPLVAGLSIWSHWCLVLVLEGIWEVAENSAAVISRYRKTTVSLGYEGDSVANSVGDSVACSLGFFLARFLEFYPSLVLFLVLEIGLFHWIQDNLILNIIMMIYPVEAIKKWQMEALKKAKEAPRQEEEKD